MFAYCCRDEEQREPPDKKHRETDPRPKKTKQLRTKKGKPHTASNAEKVAFRNQASGLMWRRGGPCSDQPTTLQWLHIFSSKVAVFAFFILFRQLQQTTAIFGRCTSACEMRGRLKALVAAAGSSVFVLVLVVASSGHSNRNAEPERDSIISGEGEISEQQLYARAQTAQVLFAHKTKFACNALNAASQRSPD